MPFPFLSPLFCPGPGRAADSALGPVYLQGDCPLVAAGDQTRAGFRIAAGHITRLSRKALESAVQSSLRMRFPGGTAQTRLARPGEIEMAFPSGGGLFSGLQTWSQVKAYADGKNT